MTIIIKIKLHEEEIIKRREEIKKIEQIYNSLNPLKQEEIRKETENRLPDFWKVQLNKERINLSAPACACSHADRCNLPAAPTAQVDAQAEGKTSKMLEVVLEEKRREIIKE